jgi:ABC-type transport system involved in cytochrome bd biosynthesis fused ATPase/permease subunit
LTSRNDNAKKTFPDFQNFLLEFYKDLEVISCFLTISISKIFNSFLGIFFLSIFFAKVSSSFLLPFLLAVGFNIIYKFIVYLKNNKKLNLCNEKGLIYENKLFEMVIGLNTFQNGNALKTLFQKLSRKSINFKNKHSEYENSENNSFFLLKVFNLLFFM